ncbi:MAG: RdgB/HAM1 family non-canonical purine NTP pyrophosphatase [Halobacteria archaeon]
MGMDGIRNFTMIFVTSNPGKAKEAREILGRDLDRRNYDYREIQTDSIREVAEDGAEKCFAELGEPCFVDDSGLFVDGLGGFPGPYSSYVHGTLGNEGLLNASSGLEDREAEFRCVVAYCDGDTTKSFSGVVKSALTIEQRGSNGFGFDPVFEYRPEREDGGVDELCGTTLAELSGNQKNRISHRKRAFEEFRCWL